MHVKLVGRASLVGDRVDVRVGPALVDAHHPLAAVDGAFNAVMLQGDAIREITLEGPRRRRQRDCVGGRRGHGLDRRHDRHRLSSERPRMALAGARCRRVSSRRPGTCGSRSRTAPACWRASRTSSPHVGVSVARLVQQPGDGHAVLHVVTHEAAGGRVQAALEAIRATPRVERERERTARGVPARRRGAGLGVAHTGCAGLR